MLVCFGEPDLVALFFLFSGVEETDLGDGTHFFWIMLSFSTKNKTLGEITVGHFKML